MDILYKEVVLFVEDIVIVLLYLLIPARETTLPA
jgi:hypothetical protein